MIAFLVGYELWYAYYVSIYISPDSSHYLGEAINILAGYGFNNNGLLGRDGWFAAWPIGYPFLIALVSKITTFNVYMSSKLLSVILISLLLLVLLKRFSKNAFLVTLVFFNVGFLNAYKYTWSEIPFIVFVVMYGFSLTDVILKKEKKNSIMLFIWTILAFLMRYVGACLGVVSGIAWIAMLFHYLRDGKKNIEVKRNLVYLFVSGMSAAIFIGCYFLNNYVHCGLISGVGRTRMVDNYEELTYNLQNSLINEILNVFNIAKADYLNDLNMEFLAWIFAILLISGVWAVKKNYNISISVRKVFVCIGGFYYLFFIFIRFHSSMDEFGSRFLIPGTILIEIALLDWLSEHIKMYIKEICIISTAILFVITASIWTDILKSRYEESAYEKSRNAVLMVLKDVPSNSYVFGNTMDVVEFNHLERVHRPDISYDRMPKFSSYDDLIDFVNAKTNQGYRYVCILRSVFEKIDGYEDICDKLCIDREDMGWETMILDTMTRTVSLK